MTAGGMPGGLESENSGRRRRAFSGPGNVWRGLSNGETSFCGEPGALVGGTEVAISLPSKIQRKDVAPLPLVHT